MSIEQLEDMVSKGIHRTVELLIHIPIGLLVIDSNGKIESIGKSLVDLTGLDPADAVGRDAATTIFSYPTEKFLPRLRECKNQLVRATAIKADGTPAPVLVLVGSLPSEEKLLLCVVDLTLSEQQL